ncbi:MAG TPA: extracellular solute-binding protein [Candidatus Binatia bacterium]|nr:extracellular solute-binding protein [Candidatus Binatia bacterium]
MMKSLSQIFQRTVLAVGFLLFWVIDGTVAAQAKPNWEQEWEKTLEAAKKEGQVTVYIAGYEAVLPDFQKDYPDIKLVAVAARGSDLVQRLSAERRAEKYLADVYSAGGGSLYRILYLGKMLDPIKPALILPEITDPTKWYQQKHHYSDPEEQYIFNYVGSATYGGIGYNTELVDPKEFKSYWDLLDAKWKGKIIARDIRTPGPGSGNARFFFHHPELGAPFIRKLFGEMDITLFRDYRQGPDWLAVGKYAICFSCDVDVLKQQGLPVETIGPNVFKEGGAMVQQFGSLTMVNKAPHPNAAKVFINWLLSRRGQIALQKRLANGESPADSLRIDIPKDDVPLLVRRMEGVKYLDASKPEWLSMKPILKVMNEALKSAGKQ